MLGWYTFIEIKLHFDIHTGIIIVIVVLFVKHVVHLFHSAGNE